MGTSMKDALQKLGLKPTVKKNERPKFKSKPRPNLPRPNPNPKPRSRINDRPVEKMHTHQEHRTICDHCMKSYPDVEFYRHRNPCVEVEWLCCRCADDNCINDECRQTKQSEYSRKRIFRRNYGRTKRF